MDFFAIIIDIEPVSRSRFSGNGISPVDTHDQVGTSSFSVQDLLNLVRSHIYALLPGFLLHLLICRDVFVRCDDLQILSIEMLLQRKRTRTTVFFIDPLLRRGQARALVIGVDRLCPDLYCSDILRVCRKVKFLPEGILTIDRCICKIIVVLAHILVQIFACCIPLQLRQLIIRPCSACQRTPLRVLRVLGKIWLPVIMPIHVV